MGEGEAQTGEQAGPGLRLTAGALLSYKVRTTGLTVVKILSNFNKQRKKEDNGPCL